MSEPWDAGTPGLVRLPDGRTVVGCAARSLPALDPELVVALHRGGVPGGPDVARIAWPDFRLPRDPDAAVEILRAAYDAATTRRVAICCRGGRGRTGTALAVLARLGGVPAADAVAWVRAAYDVHAVETAAQERWVTSALG